MNVAISIILIIISVAMTALVLLQSKGADLGGFLGGGGGEGGVKRTRRGVELVMHRFTIALAATFFILVLVAFFILGGG